MRSSLFIKVLCAEVCACEELCVKESYVYERVVCRSARPDPVQCRQCHACNTNALSVPPSAMPATLKQLASKQTKPDQARHESQPRATKLYVKELCLTRLCWKELCVCVTMLYAKGTKNKEGNKKG